jgi:hypothetical protein
MKHKFISAIVLGSIAAAGFAQASQKSFTGLVSDSMCGKQHMMKNKSAAECTRECVQAGSDYALVVGGKVYTLKGDKAQIDKFAGEKATVTGTANGETIDVSSISAAR